MNRVSLSAKKSTQMTYCSADTGEGPPRGLRAPSLWTLNPGKEVAQLIMRGETLKASIWLPRSLRIRLMRTKIVFKSKLRILTPWDAPSAEKAASAMILTAMTYLRYKSKIHLPRTMKPIGIIWIKEVPNKKIMMTNSVHLTNWTMELPISGQKFLHRLIQMRRSLDQRDNLSQSVIKMVIDWGMGRLTMLMMMLINRRSCKIS